MSFGLALGLGSLGAATLGPITDAAGIKAVYRMTMLPLLLGPLTGFLSGRPSTPWAH